MKQENENRLYNLGIAAESSVIENLVKDGHSSDKWLKLDARLQIMHLVLDIVSDSLSTDRQKIRKYLVTKANSRKREDELLVILDEADILLNGELEEKLMDKLNRLGEMV